MPRVLVVYYSRTGSCEQLARTLANELGAELEVIRPSQTYAGVGGYFKGILQNLASVRPAIAVARDPAGYDLVVVGAPVWVGRLAAPMRSYLAQHGRNVSVLAAFCVSGRGGTWHGFFDEVERLTGKRPAVTLALAQRQLQQSEPKSLLAPLLDGVQVITNRLLQRAGPSVDPKHASS